MQVEHFYEAADFLFFFLSTIFIGDYRCGKILSFHIPANVQLISLTLQKPVSGEWNNLVNRQQVGGTQERKFLPLGVIKKVEVIVLVV